MADTSGDRPAPARTLLERKIRELNMSYEEFTEFATAYARDHGEPGTLSTRQLQRLLTARPDAPAWPRPATRRLLERIFDVPADVLLRPLSESDAGREIDEWRRQVATLDREIVAAQRVDPDTLDLFATQIDTTRRLDRRFGAATLLDPLRLHIGIVETLYTYAAADASIRGLAAVLADAHALAAWQSLDRGRLADAWHHSRRACETACAAESPAMLAHALAEQGVILADAGRTADAVRLSEHARTTGAGSSTLMRSWLAAAHGEALASDGRRDGSLRAFDDAAGLLAEHCDPAHGEPYVALNTGHLTRWRGHALARFGHPDAVAVLQAALASHDVEFSRAAAALRTDLTAAYLSNDEHEAARDQHARARTAAESVGSARQTRRLDALRREFERP